MRPVVLLFPLLLFACAPRAILLVDASQSPSRNAESSPSGPAPSNGPPIEQGDEQIGLLEPRTLTRMPEERDMRPTVDPEADRPVIVNPPTGE